MKKILLIGVFVLAGTSSMVSADVLGGDMPPENAKALSDIVTMIEQRPDFKAFESIEFDDGAYEVEYYNKEGSEVEIRVDPVSGQVK